MAVITREDLDRLGECALIVLPNVMRMDDVEVEAIRDYVANGGRLIASGYTSLVDVTGERHRDFRLADLFGCRFEMLDEAAIGYARPLHPALSKAIAPLLSVPIAGEPLEAATSKGLFIAVTASPATEVLVALTRPFADGRGTKEDRDWVSSHASPPFADTQRPVVIRNRFGAGEAVYVAADLDVRANNPGPTRQLLLALLRLMLPGPPVFEVCGDPGIWAIGHRLSAGGLRLSVLNYPDCLPARPSRPLTMHLAAGDLFTRIESLPGRVPVPFELDGKGRIRFEVDGIERLRVFEAFRGPPSV